MEHHHGTIRIGRISGIPLRFDWSLLVVVALISWSLATVTLPDSVAGYSTTAYWIAGVLTAVAFFASIAAHEISHSIVAQHSGVQVQSVTLWLLGGVAQLEGDAPTPGRDFAIAIAGPLASFGVAIGASIGALLLHAAGVSALAVAALWSLASINAILGVFNLFPAAPLDGGRVLRAALWRRHGDRLRAQASAARAGTFFGYGLITLGLFEFAGGGSVGGLWFVFLGWFVLSAARSEFADARVRSDLGGLTIAAIMTPEPITVPADLPLDRFVEEYVLSKHCGSFPTVGPDGSVVGLVTLGQVRAIDMAMRHRLHVRDAAVPLAQVLIARSDEAVIDVLRRGGGVGDRRILVLDGERLVGIVTASDVLRALQTAEIRRAVSAG